MFTGRRDKARIDELEEELAFYRGMKETLREEMLWFSLDRSGHFRDADAEFLASTGYGREQLIGSSIEGYLLPVHMDNRHQQLLLDAIRSGKHWHGAMRLRKADGSDGWYRLIMYRAKSSEGGHESRALAVELTRTIRRSRQEGDLLLALHRSMAVIEFTPQGEILTANDNFLAAIGYQKDQIVGQHHKIFCDPQEAASEEYRLFWQRLGQGEYVSGRFRRLDHMGREIWLEASYNPIHNDDGELYKVVKFATDITERMQHEFAIAETSDVAYEISQKTDADASAGLEIIENTIETMTGLSDQMVQASQGVFDLNAQSEQVSALVSGIQGIAEQTNLLALNAAIEAARAGEQGRGFAVVADEVRKLALRTSEATREIIDVVGRNRQLTEQAVSLIEQSLEKVSEAGELSRKAGKAMAEMQAGAQEVVTTVSSLKSRL